MKFKQISFQEHPILGNLSLDFSDAEGNIADTVILAGENGCGKTTVLESIFNFSNFSFQKADPPSKEKFIIRFTSDELDEMNTIENIKGFFDDPPFNNEITFSFDYSLRNWNRIVVSWYGKDGVQKPTVTGGVIEGSIFKKIIRSAYSDVAINYNPRAISNITSTDIDQAPPSTIRSNINLATEITQLLVDIQSLDDSDIATWFRVNEEGRPDVTMMINRMSRFREAFDYMFDDLEYREISNVADVKQVTFQRGGHDIRIEALSSGEKQIVFRGGFLLKDQLSLMGAPVLIDEPEISMHPKWQLKILDFYKKLFTNQDGIQLSQIIVATHSPFILHNESRFNDRVLILGRDAAGSISHEPESNYYNWTPDETVKEAFNLEVVANFDQTKKQVLLEGQIDEIYFRKALELFDLDKLGIDFHWVGRNIRQGVNENAGDTGLNDARKVFQANPYVLHNHMILLYDCDTQKPDLDVGYLHIRTNPAREDGLFHKGVENLLILPEDFNTHDFLGPESNKDYEDSFLLKTHRERKLDKMKLCKAICESDDPEYQKTVLANLKDVILSMNQIG